jgi:DNA (cytosine-5)-methyltransferase 1
LSGLAPALSFQIRKLTPLECERAMGMPDGWTAGLEDRARWEISGNAVSRDLLEWIGHRIVAATA